MTRIPRLTLIATFTALAMLSPSLRLTGTAHAAMSWQGTWRFQLSIQCTRSSQPENDPCAIMLGPSGISSFTNGMVGYCNAAGICSYRSQFTATNHVGSGPLCSNDVFVIPYYGTCHEEERGTAAIMMSECTGHYGFFLLDEYANYIWYGPGYLPPVYNVHDPAGASNYPLDICSPVLPLGVYSGNAALDLLGLSFLEGTPGISVSYTIIHTTQPGG